VPAVLSGTLNRCASAAPSPIGFRAASFPFSFVKQGSAQPLGYSSTCASASSTRSWPRPQTGAAIRTAYAPVTPDTPHRGGRVRPSRPRMRLDDRQCRTPEQRAFSAIIYVAGTKLL